MNDEVIPGVDDEAGDDVPFNTPDEEMLDLDLGIANARGEGLLDGVTGEDIFKQSYRQLPAGKYPRLEVVKFQGFPELKSYKMYVICDDGQIRSRNFNSPMVRLFFAPPGDENNQVSDNFVLPPALDEREAYHMGFKDEDAAKKNNLQSRGFHARKLKQFLAALGFQADPQGRLDPKSNMIKYWMKYDDGTRRCVGLVVEPPRMSNRPPKIDEDTGEKVVQKLYNQVKLLSYELARDARPASEPASTPTPTNGTSADEKTPETSKSSRKGGKKANVQV